MERDWGQECNRFDSWHVSFSASLFLDWLKLVCIYFFQPDKDLATSARFHQRPRTEVITTLSWRRPSKVKEGATSVATQGAANVHCTCTGGLTAMTRCVFLSAGGYHFGPAVRADTPSTTATNARGNAAAYYYLPGQHKRTNISW